TLSLFGFLDLSKAYGEVNNPTSLDQELANESVKSEVKTEWVQPNGKNNEKAKLKLKSRTDDSQTEIQTKLIHNNGKPLNNNLLEDAGNNHLYAVYQTELDGKVYEKYYFTDIRGDHKLYNEELADIKEDVLENTKKIKTDFKGFIKKLAQDNTTDSANHSNSLSAMAVVSEPSGGYYRTYSWKFYHPITRLQAGTYTSTLHFDRKSSSANVDGKTGSVWDIASFNQYEVKSYRINQLTTRNDVNYASEKIVSYGPYDDAGYTVGVDLSGLVSGNAWTFSVGAVITNNVSSIANKYGKWTWTHTSSYMQNPFVTKPGLRVTNTSGNLAIKTSHSLHASYGATHSTGVVTTYIPDR
ncbi:hypothetical protein ACFRPD_36115, partial [Streptomyces cyaneofuscatus]